MGRSVIGAASLLVACTFLLFASGCRVVQLRYAQAVAPRTNHPVEIDIGYGFNRYWTNQGPVGPLAVAVAADRLGLVWMRHKRLQILYRQFDAHGPCGVPRPSSTVEHGRETIAISCEPGIYPNDHWSSPTLSTPQPRLVAATFARHQLWIAIAEQTRVRVVALALSTGKPTSEGSIEIRDVSTLNLSIAEHATSPLLALMRKDANGAEVELLRPDRRGLVPVARHRLRTPGPLALTSYRSSYVVAFNDQGSLSVFSTRDGASGMQLVERYPLNASSIALGASRDRLSIAASGWRDGHQMLAAGRVAPMQPLKFAVDRDGIAALAVSPQHDGEVVVVTQHDRRPYGVDVQGRDLIRNFTTVRWSATRRSFSRLAPPAGWAAAADARDGVVAIFGGLSTAGHPIHAAYLLSP
jgi:hypothetical protein